MKPKRKLLTPILAGVLLLIAVLMVVLSRQSGPTFSPPALPANNGYDQLLKAAKLIAPRTGFYDEMGEDELATIVEQNRPTLDLVREALEQPISVPVDWSAEPGSAGALRLNSIQSLRSLGRAFAAEARQHMVDGKPSAAAYTALDCFQLGVKSGQGGLMIDYQVGLTIQYLSLESLKPAVLEDPALCSLVVRTLSELATKAESAESAIDREKAYVESSLTGIKGWLYRDSMLLLLEPAYDSTRLSGTQQLARLRLFITHLAIRGHHQKHSKWPEFLEQVSTEVADSIPLDPFSKQPFVYRLTDDGYQLYSVGEDKTDNGGQTDENGMQPDFFFDLEPAKP